MISTANRHQLKWFVIVNFFPALAFLIISEGVSSTLSGFAAFQLLYVFIIVKQAFIGSIFLSLTANETGETLDNFIFAAYGFTLPLIATWIASSDIDLHLSFFFIFFFIGYFIPLIHSYFYELLIQKR